MPNYADPVEIWITQDIIGNIFNNNVNRLRSDPFFLQKPRCKIFIASLIASNIGVILKNHHSTYLIGTELKPFALDNNQGFRV